MVSWLMNLVQGDFANNPTAWIDLLIDIVCIAASPIAWFIRSSLAKSEAETVQHKFEEQIDVLKGQRDEARKQAESQKAIADSLESQVKLLERQVEALETQADWTTRASSVPRWSIEQTKPRSIEYVVENLNSTDAFDVKIKLSNEKEYELGDMSAGSSKKIDFPELAVWGIVKDEVDIGWSDQPDGVRRNLHKALSPRY